jgi:hypothetical protein
LAIVGHDDVRKVDHTQLVQGSKGGGFEGNWWTISEPVKFNRRHPQLVIVGRNCRHQPEAHDRRVLIEQNNEWRLQHRYSRS